MNFNIALVQFKPTRKNVAANIRKIKSLLSDTQADLVVLPELSNSGYLYESPESLYPFSEPQHGNGPFLTAIKGLAASTRGVIVTGYAEQDGKHLFNSACAVAPEGVIKNYRKTHLYSDEKILFMPGDSGFQTFEWKGVKIGIMICFDWIFSESTRTLSLLGAQIIAHPSNLVLLYCQDAMITRSIENRVFTITANRIGTEHLGDTQLKFTGGSQFTAPNGKVMFRAPKSKTVVHVLTIDPDEALDKSISARNDLFLDRRTEFYVID